MSDTKSDLSASDRVENIHGESKRVIVTEEDDARIRKATDKVVLSILCWVYFLQILDKSVIGYATAFGLREDAGLVGDQYSNLGAAGYYGHIAVQPLSALMLVKVPVRTLMPILVFCWGASLCGMAGSHNYPGLLASRVLLGIFEAAVLPLFTIIVSNWYRRSEQPLRVAAFYSTNGIATVLGSLLSYGLGHIKGGPLHSYQIIFLVTGLVTVVTAPVLYLFLDNSVAEARFLSPEDRLKAVERLRANQTSATAATAKFKWKQVVEVFIEPKTWMWMSMNFFLNAGASVSSVFGPILLGSFGFDSYTLTLLNMPFGALQFIIIWLTSWVAWSTSRKSPILFFTVIPTIIGLALLYTRGRDVVDRGANLAGYYMLAPLFAGNPLIIAWVAANTAGQTKKATIMSFYQAALGAGNICGPFLFRARDKPFYYHGIRIVLGFFVAIAGLVVLQALNLMFLNKLQSRKRVKNGKPANLEDLSMSHHFRQEDEVLPGGDDHEAGRREGLGKDAFSDKTDRENDEFIYVL